MSSSSRGASLPGSNAGPSTQREVSTEVIVVVDETKPESPLKERNGALPSAISPAVPSAPVAFPPIHPPAQADHGPQAGPSAASFVGPVPIAVAAAAAAAAPVPRSSILAYVQRQDPATASGISNSNHLKELEKKLLLRQETLALRESTLQQTELHLTRLQEELELCRQMLEREDKRWDQQKAKLDTRIQLLQHTLRDSLAEEARRKREDVARQLIDRQQKIGQVVFRRQGVEVVEMFEFGPAFREITLKLSSIAEEAKRAEQMRKAIAARKRLALKELQSPSSSAAGATGGKTRQGPAPQGKDDEDDAAATAAGATSPGFAMAASAADASPGGSHLACVSAFSLRDCAEWEEICKLRLLALKGEEIEVLARKDHLDVEKILLLKDLRRKREEDRSVFNGFPCLKDGRYLLLRLCGKGGFSEVWESFDLENCRKVACKIHQLNPSWTEERKDNYIKHAMREYEIHRRLVHHRVVRLFDVFEIDTTAFCTVLEYVDGGMDLETHLQCHKGCLPEREARSIIAQIVSGLKFFYDQKPRIIHYDMKPANVLIRDGSIKITDFGLSKVMQSDETDGIELTSQGSGTYWYLPPECFMTGHSAGGAGMGQHVPPKISSKVDVWSTGVIFYEMLFGRRPFGHDMTPQKILTERTILNATRVEFPASSLAKVSQEARDFISRCLEHSQYHRPDVNDLYEHPYLNSVAEAATGGRSRRESAALTPTSAAAAASSLSATAAAAAAGALPLPGHVVGGGPYGGAHGGAHHYHHAHPLHHHANHPNPI